jgi:16S rRNA (guanine966-N2)-methyltransferase
MRVIAGRLRSRNLKAPPGDATRPTGARVKEALFSILGDVSDLAVLDLYAGSGALGIEALSRGSARAVFVESARPALAALRDNLESLALGGEAKVLPLRVEAAKAQLAALGPFDLVLCDPPWRDAQQALEALEALAGPSMGIFSATARVVLEHAAKDPIAPANEAGALIAADRRSWGDTAVTIFTVKARPANAPVENPSLT